MDVDAAIRGQLLQIAKNAYAVRPCHKCGGADVLMLDSFAEGRALADVAAASKRGEFPGMSLADAQSSLGSLLTEISPECPLCGEVSTENDDYLLRGLSTKTEDLDESAHWIYNEFERRDLPEIERYLSGIAADHPDDSRCRLVQNWLGSVFAQYQRAYHAEAAARRSAPIWQTRERVQEKEELEAARQRISCLTRELDAARAPEREWQRHQDDYRATRAAQDYLQTLERVATNLSRFLVAGIAVFLVVLVGDVWAVVAPGDLYRAAGRLVIGGCAFVTVFGPFLLYTVYKDERSAQTKLNKYRRSLEKHNQQNGPEVVEGTQ